MKLRIIPSSNGVKVQWKLGLFWKDHSETRHPNDLVPKEFRDRQTATDWIKAYYGAEAKIVER